MASAARRGGGSPVAYLSRVVLAISHSAVFLSCSAFSVSLFEFLAATGHSGQATSFFAHLSSSLDGLVAAAAAAADVSSKTTNFYRPTDPRPTPERGACLLRLSVRLPVQGVVPPSPSVRPSFHGARAVLGHVLAVPALSSPLLSSLLKS